MTDEAPKTGWFSKLKLGLSKSSSKLTAGIAGIFTKRKLDSITLEELEELLISADLGVKTAASITARLAKDRFDKQILPEEVRLAVASEVAKVLAPYSHPLVIDASLKPQIILVCGVNGNGKTTTIGKLAKRYKDEGKSVMIAACDTFRAAAVEQLAIWAERADVPLIQGGFQAEPASVAYMACEKAAASKADILLIDTAGRLQNKTNLMDELVKIVRVITKVNPNAPHNTLLVLDATTGQNAKSQVEIFSKMVNLTGLIITKLDGTAKGGIVVALAEQFKLPIHAIGVGEAIDDLRPFEAQAFARGLVGDNEQEVISD